MDIVFHSANRFLFKSDEKYNIKLWCRVDIKLLLKLTTTDIVLQVTTLNIYVIKKSIVCDLFLSG
jgi:hypothetical protein